MENYIQYWPFLAGAIALVAFGAWIRMVLKRRRLYQRYIAESRKLCPLREELEDKWRLFHIEKRQGIEIERVPSKLEKEATKSRKRILPILEEICDPIKPEEEKKTVREELTSISTFADVFSSVPWRLIYLAGDITKGIFFAFRLSMPKYKVGNLQAKLAKVPELKESAEKAISDVEKLAKSAKFLTSKERKRRMERKTEKVHRHEIERQRQLIAVLKRNLRSRIDYVMTRQQEESLALGEVGIDRGLNILDFEKAKKTWEEKVREIGALEEVEQLLDSATAKDDFLALKKARESLQTAIHKYEELNISFRLMTPLRQPNTTGVESQGEAVSEDMLPTFIEQRAIKIKERVDDLNVALERLDVLEIQMGIRTEPLEEVALIKELLEVAGQHWAALEWEELRHTLTSITEQVNFVSQRISNWQEWVRLILPMRDKAEWLDEMNETISEVHKIEIEEERSWQLTKRKLKDDILEHWAAFNEKEMNKMIPEIRESLNRRQQILANRVFEKSEEMELKPDVSDRAVEVLRKLHDKILAGPPEDDRARHVGVPQPTTYQPRVQASGEMVTSDMGTQLSAHLQEAWAGSDSKKSADPVEEEQEVKHESGILSAIRRSQEEYEKRRGE